MRWSAPADRGVVEAVIAAFRDPGDRSCQRLASLKPRQWLHSYHWLDGSGLAIYLLEHVEKLGIEDDLPAATLERLRTNHADNRRRSAILFDEFVQINRAFQQAGIDYCNLKGFTLSPDSCADASLRCQLDLDFQVAARHLNLCRELLIARGYVRSAATSTVWEFKAGASELVDIKDHYKPTSQRSVELHFTLSVTDELLQRRTSRPWGEDGFPVLSASDQFIGQALHLFGHICGAYTRVSWLLEYKRHIEIRREDDDFWDEVRERAKGYPHAAVAIGLVTLLCSNLLGATSPARLNQWTLDCLPATVRLWAEKYGSRSILADFPGTKLYILLMNELRQSDKSWQQEKRRNLLPSRTAPRILHARPNESLWRRLQRESYQLRFLFFRLRFHIAQGISYAIESSRWKRDLARLQRARRVSGSERMRPDAIEQRTLDKI